MQKVILSGNQSCKVIRKRVACKGECIIKAVVVSDCPGSSYELLVNGKRVGGHVFKDPGVDGEEIAVKGDRLDIALELYKGNGDTKFEYSLEVKGGVDIDDFVSGLIGVIVDAVWRKVVG